MSLKAVLFAIALCLFSFSHAQTIPPHTFGEPYASEYEMKNYPLDPEATGVVLYERGNYTVDAADGYIRLIKEVHKKIKVFDAKNFDYGTVAIPYYRQNNVRENIKGLQAITHNGKSKLYVSENAIFDTDENQHWSQKKFAFANIQDGSILEYTYRIETPYLINIGGWSFMNDLPTVYSELHTEIPGNYTYNRTLYGDRKLDWEHAEIKLSCFHLPGFKVPGDCESATYVMKNIPAFNKEEFMRSKFNYIPYMKFELRDVVNINESRFTLSKTWKDVDSKYRHDKDLGRQLKYANYFEEKLPAAILSISDDLERAKAVYYFIQKNMNWNKMKSSFTENRVKEAFEKGVGNSSEINLSLINALKAANIDAEIMLIATRENALPTKQYPVLTDFNYTLVFVTLNNEKYLLDATDKYTPFGVLPIRALNGEGRVLDFKKGSYWEPITPISRNIHYVNMQLKTDESGLFSGEISEVSTGYVSLLKRKMYNDYSKEEVLKRKQSANEALNLTNLEVENQKNLDMPYKEHYNISLHQQPVGDLLYLYPFLMQTYFSENPFKKENRLYPIDFGFPVTNNYLISIDVADQYEIVQLPQNRILKLPEDDGEITVVYKVSQNKINIRLHVKLNNHEFAKEAYKSLKEFFAELIRIQSEEPIQLKRI